MSLSKSLRSRLAIGLLATPALALPLAGQASAAGGALLKIDRAKPANFLTEQYHTPSYLMLAAAPAATLDELFGKSERGRTAASPMRGGEFYTFLAMRNRFLDPVAIKNCNDSSESWFTAAKLGIEYKGKRGTSRGSVLPEMTLNGDSYPTGYYFKVSSPNWLTEAVGSMEIYQSRSASMIVDANPGDNAVISPEEILSHQGLGGGHRCLPGSASCAKEDFFSKTLGQSFELYGEIATPKSPVVPKADAATEKTAPALTKAETGGGEGSSTKTSWSKVFTLCEKIKSTAQDLGLSEIDALLVRWALVNRAKLYPVLRAYHEKNDTPYGSAISAAARVGNPAPATECWDFGSDERKLGIINHVPQFPALAHHKLAGVNNIH